jgi:acetate kinase
VRPWAGWTHWFFAGGIGESSSAVRQRICRGMEFLDMHLDIERNSVNASVISAEDSLVTVRVIKTNDELMIAPDTIALIS